MKTLLSLFDYTGNWSYPFIENGWNVLCWDIKHPDRIVDNVSTFNIDLLDDKVNAEFFYSGIFDNFGTIDGILAAVPCTAFAVSGARWFSQKDADGTTQKAVDLVYRTLNIIDVCKPNFWCIENPVSRIASLVPQIGKPKMTFNPCDFGDPYTKKTVLYGDFSTKLKRTPVEAVEGSKMHRLYGGKSERTKEMRSKTPMGFANAFFEANKDYVANYDEQLNLF